MKKWGGPRTLDFIIANLDGPYVEIVRREHAKAEVSDLGLTDKYFQHLATVYAGLMKTHSVIDPVLVQATEDETGIRKEGQWRQRDNSLYGS